MPFDMYGQALHDYLHEQSHETLWLNNSYGDPEKMPVEVFFREEDELSDLEKYALTLAEGRILDVGAGAGAHAIILQEHGFDVTALDHSTIACDIMRDLGVRQVVRADIFTYQEKSYDTLWLMMNGIGIIGKIENLLSGLKHLKRLLKSGGKVILDSSDIRYLYSNDLPQDRYFGEIDYQYVYKGEAGEWFTWLFLDQRMLTHFAEMAGFSCQIVFENKEDQYLAVLTT